MNTDFDDHEEEEDEEMEAPPSRHNNSSTRFRYRECLKNHAVGLGGHALDGCGEFMPAGADGTLDALKCAACTCHRNFHRKEDRWAPPPPLPHFYHRAQAPPAGYLHVAGAQRHLLALPSTSGGDDEPSGSSGRKRFRTKFTAEQKEKMVELAERVGWRIQKHDEEVVQTFCNENGVKRHVLKVWMHNNKHTLGWS